MNLGLRGRKVVVTGASRGIGRATAEQFAAEQCDLALVARTDAAILELATKLREGGVNAVAISADVSSSGGAKGAIDEARRQLGTVDVLVNNAGTSPFGSFDVIDDAAWTAAFELKLLGYVRCIRAVLPLMRAQRSGTIINVVGTAGRNATPGYVLGAFNAALLHLTKSVAELVVEEGIRVVAINPGFTNTARATTAMRLWAAEEGMDEESYTRQFVSDLPLGRFAEPDEIARMIVLLASDVMAPATGSALQADTGAAKGHF